MKMFLATALALFTSCSMANQQPPVNSDPMERALIVGSAESPDPVLTRVQELEKSGMVKDVVIQESFPVQIRLRAPRNVIDELNKIPRVGGIQQKP